MILRFWFSCWRSLLWMLWCSKSSSRNTDGNTWNKIKFYINNSLANAPQYLRTLVSNRLIELGKKNQYDGPGIAEESPFLIQDSLINAILIKSNQALWRPLAVKRLKVIYFYIYIFIFIFSFFTFLYFIKIRPKNIVIVIKGTFGRYFI